MGNLKQIALLLAKAVSYTIVVLAAISFIRQFIGVADGYGDDRDFLFLEFNFVLERKSFIPHRHYNFYGAQEGKGYSEVYSTFERYDLLPLYEEVVLGDTLVKQPGDSTITVRGRAGQRRYKARLSLPRD